eukprot:1655076-Rhodomonas_salina.1
MLGWRERRGQVRDHGEDAERLRGGIGRGRGGGGGGEERRRGEEGERQDGREGVASRRAREDTVERERGSGRGAGPEEGEAKQGEREDEAWFGNTGSSHGEEVAVMCDGDCSVGRW